MDTENMTNPELSGIRRVVRAVCNPLTADALPLIYDKTNRLLEKDENSYTLAQRQLTYLPWMVLRKRQPVAGQESWWSNMRSRVADVGTRTAETLCLSPAREMDIEMEEGLLPSMSDPATIGSPNFDVLSSDPSNRAVTSPDSQPQGVKVDAQVLREEDCSYKPTIQTFYSLELALRYTNLFAQADRPSAPLKIRSDCCWNEEFVIVKLNFAYKRTKNPNSDLTIQLDTVSEAQVKSMLEDSAGSAPIPVGIDQVNKCAGETKTFYFEIDGPTAQLSQCEWDEEPYAWTGADGVTHVVYTDH